MTFCVFFLRPVKPRVFARYVGPSCRTQNEGDGPILYAEAERYCRAPVQNPVVFLKFERLRISSLKVSCRAWHSLGRLWAISDLPDTCSTCHSTLGNLKCRLPSFGAGIIRAAQHIPLGPFVSLGLCPCLGRKKTCQVRRKYLLIYTRQKQSPKVFEENFPVGSLGPGSRQPTH
jgi:hypothetical protein